MSHEGHKEGEAWGHQSTWNSAGDMAATGGGMEGQWGGDPVNECHLGVLYAPAWKGPAVGNGGPISERHTELYAPIWKGFRGQQCVCV